MRNFKYLIEGNAVSIDASNPHSIDASLWKSQNLQMLASMLILHLASMLGSCPIRTLFIVASMLENHLASMLSPESDTPCACLASMLHSYLASMLSPSFTDLSKFKTPSLLVPMPLTTEAHGNSKKHLSGNLRIIFLGGEFSSSFITH